MAIIISLFRYHNEFAIEKFDENGEATDKMIERWGVFNVSIADMLRKTEKFEKLPPHVFRILQ